MIKEVLKESGFINKNNEKEWNNVIQDEVKFLLSAASTFREGLILERRGSKIQVRILGFNGVKILFSHLKKRLKSQHNSSVSKIQS